MDGNLTDLGLGGSTGPVTSIVNASSAATTAIPIASAANNANALTLLSGALTAGVLKTVLSATGRGRVGCAALWHTSDATTRTVRIKVTVDGVVVFDRTANNFSGNTAGLVAIGTVAGGLQWVEYRQSIKIEIASSLTETDKLSAAYVQEVWQ